MNTHEKITNAETILNSKGTSVFSTLQTNIYENEDDLSKNEISLSKLNFILALYGKNANIPQNVQDIILKYNLPVNIMENRIKNGENIGAFTKETFGSFVSGQDVKETLFNSSLNDKRKKVEILTQVFYILGGTKEGISINKLEKSLSTFYLILTDPEGYLSGKDSSGQCNVFASKAIKEMEELLGSKEGVISLNDFINMMTSESDYNSIEDPELMF